MCVLSANSWCFSWIFMWMLSQMTCTQAGIYIPKRSYTFYMDKPASIDDVIGVIHVSPHKVITCGNNVSVDISSPPELPDVSVELENMKIFIRSLSDSLSVTDTSEFEVSLTCSDQSVPLLPYYRFLTLTKVKLKNHYNSSNNGTLSPLADDDVSTGSGDIKAMCPPDEDLVYNVIENMESGVIDVFADHRLPYGAVELASSVSDEYLFLNTTSGELVQLKSLDRERKEQHVLTVLCTVQAEGQPNVTVSRSLKVNVVDVNDNPPFTSITTPIQLTSYTAENTVILFTFDSDNATITKANSYRVYTNDTLGVVSLSNSLFRYFNRKGAPTSGTIIQTVVTVLTQNISTPYTVDIVLEDLTYEPAGDSETVYNKQAIHRITILDHTSDVKRFTYTASIDNASGKYSLVINLGSKDGPGSSNTTKYDISGMTPIYMENFLAVTPAGNLYVNDTVKLSRYSESKPITVRVMKTEDGVKTVEFQISVTVNNNLRTVPAKCDTGCSVHNTREKCVASCGYGSTTGLCSWREGDTTMSINYSTCSPNLHTCPDGLCSDLESLHFLNCPQDCSKSPVHGQLIRQNNQGIYQAKGPCWCERKPTDGKIHCICDPLNGVKRNTPITAGHIAATKGKQNADNSAHGSDDSDACSSSCKAAITGSLTAAVVCTILVLSGWMMWRRRRRRQAMSLKHVSSLVSMTAVPSDYIVDDSRDLRGHVNRQTSSPASGHWPMKLGMDQDMFEDKWEFPRRYLTLEHVIGEGEFGQVVRAQAHMLRGQEGNTVVAVKMLKPDASGSEYQDLVSEFQLLKEVVHPNVIQLLGVCTQKGPLYVIVEYCKLGSLRNFLRSSKFKNKVSWDERMKSGNDSQTVADSTAEVRILTCRDFFSFAWQVAKGMDYLASLKIVHRDLAARNVLVTDGLKMKISDFGLSRDVYEADTYLKMSKGRIPVKWMAPESLYGQIYTTKSDIWSFGIVLWEIVTLGASPYPGIPPERLFPLLSTGYRMDRPDECPDELYAIMQKCWKLEPENRPPFSALRVILDNLLQQNTEYLDLSNDNYLLHGTTSDNSDKQTEFCINPKPQQYNNITCADHCPSNVYVTTHWEGDDLDNEECPEMSKLLGNKEVIETQLGPVNHPDILMEKCVKDSRDINDHTQVHDNLTYV